MIEKRQEELEITYDEAFGEGPETVIHTIGDLILEPDADPPRDKFKRLAKNEAFLEIWENEGDFPSLSEHDMSLAGYAAADGWNDQEIANLIIAFRRRHGQSKKEQEKALRADYINRTLSNIQRGTGNKRQSIATQLVAMVKDIDLFHTPSQDVYAVIDRDGHSEVWALESRTFKDHMARRFYEKIGSTPGSQSIQNALNVLRGQALFSGREELVYVRLAEYDRNIYLDLCDPDWRVVEISPQGWGIIKESPVYFVRSRGMSRLPDPEPSGGIEELRKLVNIEDADWPLLLACILGSLRPSGPKPIVVVTGEQGSAKTTLERMMRLLVDPSTAPLRSLPRDERDLAISASNAWILAFDNVSYLRPWLSDAICRLATGGGFATRQLYTDNEEVLFTATRPVLLNGIGDIATQSDLLDRAIIINLPVIPDNERRTEVDLWEEFETIRPRMLGVLLDAVSLGLRNYDSVNLDKKPRMADFAQWVVAAIPALGMDPTDFLDAYYLNIERINQLALESSPVIRELMTLVAELPEGGEWVRTMTQLLDELNWEAGDFAQRQRNWPKSPRSLSAILNRLAPNLRAIGLDVTFDRGSGERLIRIRRNGQKFNPPPKRPKKCIVTRVDDGFNIKMNLGH